MFQRRLDIPWSSFTIPTPRASRVRYVSWSARTPRSRPPARRSGQSAMFYDLASTTWGEEEPRAVARVLAAGRFTMGDEVRGFEQAFAARFGVTHAVMVNSGSSANLVGVAALFH